MGSSDGKPPDSSAVKAELLRQRAEHWDKGEQGERMVAAALAALPPAYRVFHEVGLPNTQITVDHVVVGPGGVIAIDSTYYEGVLKHGSGTLWRGKYPIRKECETARWAADVLSTMLQQPVESMLCFVDTTLPEPIIQLERVVVSSLDALTRHILTMPPRMSDAEMAAVASVVAPTVRTTAPRTIVSVSTTPDVTTGSARPGALPRRDMAQPKRFLASREPTEKSQTGVAVSAAFAIAFLIVMWIVWTRFEDPERQVATDTTETTVTTVPDTTIESTTTVVVSETTVPASIPLPPVVDYTCDDPGEGWTATLAPSEFLQDPEGYNVWYSVRMSPYMFWGLFKSGLRVPEPIGGLTPGETFSLKMDRQQSVDANLAPITSDFTAPAEPC